MDENLRQIYDKLVQSGSKGSYEQFVEYFNANDNNKRSVYEKLVKAGSKCTYEQFMDYVGQAPKHMTVDDVENQNSQSVVTFDKNTTSFDDWYQTVPADRNDTTNYNLRRAYELAPAEELEAWRTATPEELENGQKHLRSVYFNENGEGEFMKSKYHPTIQMELDEYEQNEDFRKRYGIDTNGTYYKYVSRGLDLYDMSMDNAAKNIQQLESVNHEIDVMELGRASDIIYGGEFNEVKYKDLLYQQALLSDYVSRLKGSEEYKRGVQEIHSFNDQFREENNLVRGDAMSKLRKHNFNLFGASGNMFMLEKFMHMSNIDMNMLAPGQEDMYNDAAADFAIYGAEQKVRLAEDELANGTGGFGTQFARGWRNSNWNKLDKQMTLNMALQAYKIAKKFDENGELLEGQTLSESETRLFKALQIAYLADNTVVETMWERIGENAPEQVKYTLEFILTSELMGASALSKGIAGAATRNIEGQVAKKLVYKAVDYTAQPLLQTLYNPLNWMEGSIERQTGNLTYDEKTGNFVFAGAEDKWDATRDAIVSAWIENFSEKIGEDIFKPAKYGNKYLRNMDNAFGRTYNQFATKIDVAIENAGLNKLDDVLKISKDIRLATGVQGIPGEYVSDVVGGIMDAMFVGDQSFHQYDENGNPNPNYLWNSEQQLETFLSCAVMSVGMTTVSNIRNNVTSAADRRKAKSYLNQMAKAMENQNIDTEAVDKAFENGTINDVSDIVFKMGSAEDMTDDKRQILANYVAAKINYAAMRNADMSAIEDSFSEIEKEAYASVNAETKDAGGAGGRIIQANVEVNGETFEGVPIVSGRVLTRIETDANGNDYMVLDTRGSSSVLYIRVPGEEKARPIYSSNVTGIVAATPVEQYIETQKNELTGMMTEMFGAQYDGGLPLEQLIAECAVLSDKEVQTGTIAVQQLEKGRKYNIVNPSTGELTEAEYVEDTENKSHVFSINGDNVELNDGELKESMLRYRLALAEESGAIDEAAQIELDALLRERETDQATAPITDDQFVETAVANQVSKDDGGNYTPDSNPRAVAVDILMKSGYDVEKARLAIANTVNGLAAQVGSEEVSAPSIDENIVNNTKNNAEYNNALIEMYSQALTEMDLYVQNYVGEPEIGETYTLTNETGTVYGRFEGYDANGNVQYRETDESGENDGRLVVLPKNEFQKQRRAHNIEIQAQKPITIENAQEIAEETPVIPTETIAENAEESAVVPPVEETPVKEEVKLPRDKDNNIDYKQITDPALYAKGLTEEFGDDAQSVIDELIADEKKNLEKAGTKNAIERRRAQKAAQSSIDFYNQVKNTLAPKPSDDVKAKNVAPKDSKAFEKRIAQAINEIGEPTSFEDEVLRRLANSSHQFKWGSDGTHKGMGAMLGFKGSGSEMISRASFLSKNGKYFDEVALDIWQDLPEAYNENHTDQEVRDLMIDFLRSYSNPFEMVDAIRQMQLGARNGETIDEAADRQQKESIESIAASYGMTVDEFNEAVYKANELNMSLDEYLAINYSKEEFVKEIALSDEQYENYTNFAAEQILAEEQGEQYDTGRTESDTELHQGEIETAQQGGIRPVVSESTGTGRERGNIGEEREVQQERNQHGSDELPDQGVAAEPYQPRSQRGKDRAVELDNAIVAQRERVASARREYDKAVGDFNKRNGLFGDTADNDDSLFGDLADFSKENFERISAEKQTKIENEQKRLDEIVAQRDNELREIDEAEDKQSALEFAEQEVDTNPTDAQKEAGNYKKGHVTIDGFDISIENPRGSVRSGVDENGNEWSVTMHDTYGYIRNTESVDGDHIDIFLSDHIGNWNGSVFVVDQVKPDGSFDEHKVMYGFDTEEEAREAYLANYSEGWQGLGNITEVSKRGFKKWIESSHRKTKPFREYRDVILNNKTVNENPSGNKLVTDEQYEELKKRLKTKGAIADSIMNGKNMMINNMENRVLEEEEDVFGDTVAQLSGSEYAMLKNQAEKDVRKYEAKYKQWQADQIYVRNELPNVKTRIEYNKKAIADAKKALGIVKKAYNGNLDITIGKLKFNSIDSMKDFITEYNKSIMAAENEVKNANGGEQTRSLTININGIDFVVNTTVKYEMLQKGTTLSYVARRNMRYSCAQLGLEDIPVKQSLVRNAIDDIVYNIMTGNEFESDIQSDQAHLDRYEKSYEQLKQRDGKEFEFTAELEASRKRLDEYTAKMKEEMEEKEKKYAAIDAEVEAAENIIEAEEAEENESEETEHLSVEENNETTDETNESQEIAFNAVKESLAKAGIEVVEATEQDIQDLMSRNRGIKDSNGKLMGWVGTDGKIYLTKEGMNAKTAIHEYTHLWAEALQMNNPELWNKIKDLLRDTPIWNEVVSLSAYENIKDNEDEIAGEALSRISGKANAKRMEDTARRIMDANPGVEGAVQAATLLGKLRDALNKFWTWVGKKLFGINKVSVADMILADLVNGVNPINPNDGNRFTGSANDIFNQELEAFGRGDLKHELHLGKPSAELQACGINATEIFIKQKTLTDHLKKHGLTIEDIKDLPLYMEKPFLAYEWGTQSKSMVVITEIPHGDERITVALKLERKGQRAEVNEIASIYPKDAARFLDEMKNAKEGGLQEALRYVSDKEKVLDWLGLVPPRGTASLTDQELSVAKIIQNFNNPTKNIENSEKLSVEAQTEFETHDMNTAIVSDILNNKLGIDSSDMRRKTIKRRLVDAKRKWMDSLDPLKKLQQSIAEATGKPLADFEDAYNAESRRSAISMSMIERYIDDYLLPMIESVGDILKEGVDEKTLGLYLIAKHGLERNEYFKKLNDWKEVQDMSGLTAIAAELDRGDEDFTQVAKDFVNEIENTVPKNMLDNMWSRINNTTNAILAKYLESGLISKKQYDDYRKRYNNYVPLRGWDETTSDEFYNYSVLDPHFQSAIKQAKGRTSLANNVLANIMNMTESAIVIGEKNKVLQRLFNLAQGRKSDVLKTQRSWYVKNQHGEWEETLPIITEDMTPEQVKSIVEQFEQNMERMSALGEAKQSLNRADVGVKIKPFNVHEHYVPVFVNGRKHAIIINADPTIVKSLTDSNELANTKFVSALRNTTRFMSQLNTTFNPEFIVKNVLRDAGMAIISSYIEGGMSYANKVRSNINKFGYRYLGQLIRNGECDNTEITQYWREFIENGGETGFTRTLNVDEQAKRLKKLYKKMLSGKDIDQKGMFETITSAIDSFNRWGEDLSRFAVFVTNRQLGKTVEQSVNMAKNATINFQRKGGGTLAAWFRTTRSFFNAGMQALYRFGSLAKNNPKRFAIASTAMVISGLLVPALNIMMLSLMGGDDDDWNAYRFMSEFTGNHSWHMFVGDGFITIPYPQEFAALFAAGNIVFRHAIGWADNNSTIAGDIANMALEQLPFDMGGGGSIDWKIMNAVTPQVLQPFVEVYINEDFMGRPIYKKNPFNENDPAWTKAYKSTSGTLVELAKRLNGNDPVMKHSKYFDWLDNPAAWQHIITGEAGGIGRIVSNVSRLVENGYTADNMPFLRNIYMTDDMSKYAPQVSRDYYNILNGFDEMKNNINGYENDGESLYDNLDRYMKLKTSPEYKAYLATKDLTKTIKEKQDSLKLMQAYDFSDEDILQMRLTITSLQIMVLDITNNMIIDEGRPMTKEFRQVIDNIKKGEGD